MRPMVASRSDSSTARLAFWISLRMLENAVLNSRTSWVPWRGTWYPTSPSPKAWTLLESSSSGRVTRRETTIISAVPEKSASRPTNQHHPVDAADGALCRFEAISRTTNCKGEVAAAERSSRCRKKTRVAELHRGGARSASGGKRAIAVPDLPAQQGQACWPQSGPR